MTIVGDIASTHPSDGQVERVGGSDLLVLGGRSSYEHLSSYEVHMNIFSLYVHLSSFEVHLLYLVHLIHLVHLVHLIETT